MAKARSPRHHHLKTSREERAEAPAHAQPRHTVLGRPNPFSIASGRVHCFATAALRLKIQGERPLQKSPDDKDDELLPPSNTAMPACFDTGLCGPRLSEGSGNGPDIMYGAN